MWRLLSDVTRMISGCSDMRKSRLGSRSNCVAFHDALRRLEAWLKEWERSRKGTEGRSRKNPGRLLGAKLFAKQHGLLSCIKKTES